MNATYTSTRLLEQRHFGFVLYHLLEVKPLVHHHKEELHAPAFSLVVSCCGSHKFGEGEFEEEQRKEVSRDTSLSRHIFL